MTFRKYDAGVVDRPKNAPKGDCQVRALATATGMSWMECWELLYEHQAKIKSCDFQLVRGLRDKDLVSDVTILRQIDFPAKKGTARMTPNQFCKKHKKGRFILRLAHHVVAVKDGVFYDLWDCGGSCVYTAWEVLKTHAVDDDVTCPEGGLCEFTADLEYDPSGQTINCEKCGVTPG